MVEGIDPDVPLAGEGLVQHQAIDSLAIGSEQMIAVQTGQGRVEQGEVQRLAMMAVAMLPTTAAQGRAMMNQGQNWRYQG